MDVATFMTLAMAHRHSGYYTTRDPLGRAGDFITAPEISQMFGELAGAAIAQAWIDLGAPASVHLVELGPGRGTLMADALRATRNLAGFHAAIRLHLVETSPVLRELQGERIRHPSRHWHEHVESLPDDAPILFIANELFDVLPVRQFVMAGDGLHERRIGVDDDDRLGFVLDPRCSRPGESDGMAEGSILEVSPAREALMTGLARRLAHQRGTGFIIDYGDLDLDGADTLQAVRAHRRVAPLDTPGKADLSSHVAFRPLLDAARREGVMAFGPLTQGEWLRRIGIETRMQRLAAGGAGGGAGGGDDDGLRARLLGEMQRLVADDQMGTLFKVVAVTTHAGPPAGFSGKERWS
ncbi:MAG: SAM-dependent methyltransferase [Geminicoccaceae bacterium]|nr:SAM-dependent methyltransferase [Geminicoccaceae bacterium]